MNSLKTTLLVLISAAVLSACTQNQVDEYQVNYDASNGVGIEEKQGDTTVSGQVTAAGGSFFLLLSDSSRIELDSYAITLQDYVGQQVTVTGQYSGDTLFVGSIE